MTLQQDSTHPTGISDDTPRGNSDVSKARARKANAALMLKKRGYTWEQIAESIGYPTARAAVVACELALQHELKTGESAEFMRHMAGERLERMLRGVWNKAIQPENPEHLAAVDRARLLIDQHADIFGYKAPKTNVVVTPATVKLEQWVSQVLQLGQPEIEEDDIFDPNIEDAVLVDPMDDGEPDATPS